nr:HD domain-containing protein [Acidaminococcus fermentans]
MKKLTYETISHAKEINIYLEQGNQVLGALGYTDHSRKHTAKVAITAGYILKKLEYDDHTIELTRIAGYMHDIGNSINRVDHAHTGALMAFQLLRE